MARLYSEAKLSVRKRKRRNLVGLDRQTTMLASHPDEIWSTDLAMDALSNARRIRCLTIVDEFTRQSSDIAVDYGISIRLSAVIVAPLSLVRRYGFDCGREPRMDCGINRPVLDLGTCGILP